MKNTKRAVGQTVPAYGDFRKHFSPDDYNIQNFGRRFSFDVNIDDFIIGILGGLLDEGFHPTKKAIDIGTGGGLRTAALLAPLVHEDGTLELADIGSRQNAATVKACRAASKGKLGYWQAHQDGMSSIDARWDGVFHRVSRLAEVVAQDLRTLPPNSYGIIGAGHCPESATDDHGEYKTYLRHMFEALVEGGLLIMPYMIGSNGYRVGSGASSFFFPAVPVYPAHHPDDIPDNGINLHTVANEIGFEILGSKAVKHVGDRENVRAPGDPTEHWGLGAAVFRRPHTKRQPIN
jgi:hypothetical protein